MMMEKWRREAVWRIYSKYWCIIQLSHDILRSNTLQDVNNVLVVVTRYFGGIHLGPDRFKHINQAARNALELGGFLDEVEAKRNTGRVKRR